MVVLITFGLVQFQDQLLAKRLVYTAADFNKSFGSFWYADGRMGGKSTIRPDPKTPLKWSCHLSNAYQYPFCSYELLFDKNVSNRGLNLNDFHTMVVDLRYRGAAPQIRFHLKNFDPRYSKPGVRDSLKYNRLEITRLDLHKPVAVAIKDFSVADWWLNENHITPELGNLQLDNIVSLEIQPGTGAPPGEHEFELRKLTFIGTLIPKTQFYILIMIFWSILVAAYIAYRVIEQRRISRRKLCDQVRRSRDLEEAMAAAETASRAKSEFLANMSHELRTPLNAILGYAQLLQRHNLDERRREEAARTIHESGTHLLTLITDILDLTKIEAGRLELCSTVLDLPASLHGVADMFRIRAAEKDLDFTCRIPMTLPQFVLGDEKRLRQVLINLLGNAIKFTDQGGVALDVSLISADLRSARVRFEVRDTGIGIPAEKIRQIFQPFEQAGDFRNRAGGTGLGLSISNQIIGLMHSRIDVESREGEGSRFWFELDLRICEQIAPASTGGSRRATGYFGPRRSILIVDDTDANRAVLTDWLGAIGFETIEASDGAEALEVAATAKPDLILMDIKMPVMNGFEATERLRAMDEFRDVPVLALSASVTAEVEEKSRKAGANGFVAKPIDQDELIHLIGRSLRIEWEYAESGLAGTGAEETDHFVAPPEHELRALLTLAQAGNMRAIRSEAQRIAALDPRYEPFAERICILASNYQSPAILRLIEEHGSARSEAA